MGGNLKKLKYPSNNSFIPLDLSKGISMHLIKIFNDKNETVYEGRFQDLLIREARGLTTEREHGDPVRLYPNGKHSLELKMWSGSTEFSLSDLNNEVELKG